MKKYDFKKIEGRWQKRWLDEKVFAAKDGSPKPKYYQLETFPYPSAAGLHVGHPKGYIAEDIHARYMRMRGHEVLYTMGWDAFGLPTENYAIKMGKSPQEVASANIESFRRQVRMFGLSYDWDREINTSSPGYYKWTQWLFLELYKKGLAYRTTAKVNWCPKDQTVLANEQVVNGKCERDGELVVQKEMQQWFLRITDYKDRLLEDLAGLDWPEATMKRQEDWIGKSEGAEIEFLISNAQFPKDAEVVFASNNQGKLKRAERLLREAGLTIRLKTPKDVGIEDFDVEEDGATLRENSEKKARAIAEKTDLPVLADDAGFFIKGELLDPVKVKRNALGGADEHALTIEEIAEKMLAYYRNIAVSSGGSVDAEWRNDLCLITADKEVIHVETVRPVLLVAEARGTMDPHLPLRPIYISKATGKYVLEQSDEEELVELAPIMEGLKKLFAPAIKVFTTRADTIFGATYLVLAPEHEAVKNLESRITNLEKIQEYVQEAARKTELMRQEKERDKTGVELKGIRAINPATGEEIPIWIADYVLGGYGTGAIMAVPAHDERDHDFAKKFNLPIRQVVAPVLRLGGICTPREDKATTKRNCASAILRNPENDTYLLLKWPNGIVGFVGGGVEEGESFKIAAEREIKEETGYVDFSLRQIFPLFYGHGYKPRKDVNCYDFEAFFVAELESDKRQALSKEDTAAHEVLWVGKEEVEKLLVLDHHREIWRYYESNVEHYTGEGVLVNSGEFDGASTEEARKKIAERFGAIRTQYRLRDWSVSRQRYWGVPIPMITCEKCGMHPVPEKDLPVLLPEDVDYRPQGIPPLASSKAFMSVACPVCGGEAVREPETLDTFVDSSWYYLRYADPHNDKAIFDKKKMEQWMPVKLYVIGAEHTVLHLLYSRFITKFLHDEGHVSFAEPFLKLRHVGLIQGADGQKMSKSKGNVVNPDEIVGEFGVDTVRVYEMFMGPFDDGQPWDPKGVLGAERFLKRFYRYAAEVLEHPEFGAAATPAAKRPILEKTTKKVGEDIVSFKFNTAISALMILINELQSAEEKGASSPVVIAKADLERIVKLLHPFAPHMGQELWTLLGHETFLDFEPWPDHDPAFIRENIVRLAVQVNGKVRATIELPGAVEEEDVKRAAMAEPKVQAALAGATPRKAIYVPGKILNFVV